LTDLTDYTVTMYKLFLGDQQTEPPFHYQRGYTIHSAYGLLFPDGGSWSFGNAGWISTNEATFFSGYILSAGDVILDAFGRYFAVKRKHEWAQGSKLRYIAYFCEQLATFPFLSGFFGFVDEEHTTSDTWFGDGFFHGYFAL
jgi:hypothetical protein